MIFRCKNCGVNIVYSPVKKTMYCPHCDGLDSEEKITNANIHQCISCGAPMEFGPYTSATKCSSCGTYVIYDERVQGVYKPEYILPFKVSKEEAADALHAEFDRRPFTPASFLSYSSIEKMEGHYVPFNLYDIKSDIHYRATGIKVSHWSDSKYDYTETSYYDVLREMQADYSKIPVDGSTTMDNQVMDLLEPYQYGEMTDFDEKYMSGFMGEVISDNEADMETRAFHKSRMFSHEFLQRSLAGYTSFTNVHESIIPTTKAKKLALLPVWEYEFGYMNQIYRFHVNAQTGKVIGKVPVSKAKVVAYGITVFGLLTLAGMMLRLVASVI